MVGIRRDACLTNIIKRINQWKGHHDACEEVGKGCKLTKGLEARKGTKEVLV